MKSILVGLVAALGLPVAVAGGSGQAAPLGKFVRVAPGVRLWIECSGSGPVALADNGLGLPTQTWDGVRGDLGRVRLCAFDRAGVGRSDVRACHCGTLEHNVSDVHVLIRAAQLRVPLILVGHSTGGLDSLLYVRRYPSDVNGLVLIDSPSESAPAPPPPGTLADGQTILDFRSGLRKLRRAGRLGRLPILILSHGKRTFSTLAAERSWTRMQRELASDSTNTLRVVALDSQHLIHVDQPRLVAAALAEAADFFPKGLRLRCLQALTTARGRCVA